ncbi:MAG: hypothetical protein LWW87_03965 [Geobacteraceae bacterium]|nr:hypothetical protein [Geobacteraceae bacterium]
MTPETSQKNSLSPDATWFDSLSQLIQPDVRHRSIGERLVEQCVRVSLMVKLRWAMLAALFCYVLLAELFLAPDIDLPIFHIEQWSFSLKAAAIFFAIAFPLTSLPCRIWKNCRLVIYLQVLVDLLFITAAIHWSGGVVSWLWPAYLLISLESAFLFEKKREVWGIGMIGAALYGLLLVAEQLDFIATVRMPFMEEESPNILFELLMWLWVAGVNTVVSFFWRLPDGEDPFRSSEGQAE